MDTTVNEKLAEHEVRLNTYETRLDKVENQVEDIHTIATSIQIMSRDITTMKDDMADMKSDQKDMKKKQEDLDAKIMEEKNSRDKNTAKNVNDIVKRIVELFVLGVVAYILSQILPDMFHV